MFQPAHTPPNAPHLDYNRNGINKRIVFPLIPKVNNLQSANKWTYQISESFCISCQQCNSPVNAFKQRSVTFLKTYRKHRASVEIIFSRTRKPGAFTSDQPVNGQTFIQLYKKHENLISGRSLKFMPVDDHTGCI